MNNNDNKYWLYLYFLGFVMQVRQLKNQFCKYGGLLFSFFFSFFNYYYKISPYTLLCSSSGICPQDITINNSKSGHLDFELWQTVFVLSLSNSEWLCEWWFSSYLCNRVGYLKTSRQPFMSSCNCCKKICLIWYRILKKEIRI